MATITLKSLYNMKNIIIASIFLLSLSCKKENKNFQNKPETNISKVSEKDTLRKIKDTTLFINSSEGEEVTFLINKKNNDSIIQSEVMGETGKSDYQFIFNKSLKEGHCTSYRYTEPIYVNSDPKIKSKTQENLSTSRETNKRLKGIFTSYHHLFSKKIKNVINSISDKWVGKYLLTLNEDHEDWRDIHEIELNVTKDSITYLAKGFQLYQYYTLSSIEGKNSLQLKFRNSLDNTDSWALKKTKDFGVLNFDGKNYIWNSPYLDTNFNDGKKNSYTLKKQN